MKPFHWVGIAVPMILHLLALFVIQLATGDRRAPDAAVNGTAPAHAPSVVKREGA